MIVELHNLLQYMSLSVINKVVFYNVLRRRMHSFVLLYLNYNYCQDILLDFDNIGKQNECPKGVEPRENAS